MYKYIEKNEWMNEWIGQANKKRKERTVYLPLFFPYHRAVITYNIPNKLHGSRCCSYWQPPFFFLYLLLDFFSEFRLGDTQQPGRTSERADEWQSKERERGTTERKSRDYWPIQEPQKHLSPTFDTQFDTTRPTSGKKMKIPTDGSHL